jgi:predicted RNA-binding Zn-ribbon protein involved in translation (DUF1610 family)
VIVIALAGIVIISVLLGIQAQGSNAPEAAHVSTTYSFTFVAILLLIPAAYYVWHRQTTLGAFKRICMGCGRNLTQLPGVIKVCPYCGRGLTSGSASREMQITVIDETNKKYAKLKVGPENTVASVTNAVVRGLKLPTDAEYVLEHAGRQFRGQDDSLTLKGIEVKNGDSLKLIPRPRKDVGYVG